MDMQFVNSILSDLEYVDKYIKEEEPYGIYRIPTSSGGLEFVRLYKEVPYEPHIHDHSTAQFIFLEGSGSLLLNDKAFKYSKGSVFDVPAGVKHGFIIEEETIFLSIQSNPIQDRTTGEIDLRYE